MVILLFVLIFNWYILFIVAKPICEIFIKPHHFHWVKHTVLKILDFNFLEKYPAFLSIKSSPIFHNVHHFAENLSFLNFQMICAGIISLSIILFLVLFFTSRVGHILIRFVSGGRNPIDRENRKILPLIEKVQSAMIEKLGCKKRKITLMIIDDEHPNALAIGNNTIMLTRGLYQLSSEDELLGVIAHEFAHLHYGDSQRLAAGLGISFMTIIISFAANIALKVSGFFSNSANSGTLIGSAVGFFSIFIFLFSLIFIFFVFIGNSILNAVSVFQGRRYELRADAFAHKLGFGKGILSYLERIKDFDFKDDKSFLGRIYSSHPPTMLRIGALERVVLEA